MAGIGFELKKLYGKKGVFPTLKAHLYSTFVTVGPMLVSIIVITFLQSILRKVGVDRGRMIVLQITIMYSFIFSVIFASGFSMVLSRYLSDKFYNKKIEDILPSLYGAISVMLIISGTIGGIFYLRSPLDFTYKLFAYLLFIELIIEMILSVYISALDDFKRISFSFLLGTIVAIMSYIILVKVVNYDYIISVLIAFDICIAVVDGALLIEIKKHFVKKSTLYFNYIKYYNKFYLLFFINLFYTIGLYAHDFAFWTLGTLRHTVEGTFIYAPLYDFPAFYAFLSAIPTLIIFVVKVETDFFEQYTSYFTLINKGACYDDIEVAKQKMISTIYLNIVYIMQIQLFFSFIGIILGMMFLPIVGFTGEMITIYNLSVMGFYCAIIMFVIMTMLLYFDDKKSAFKVAAYFLAGSFTYSLITTFLGPAFYGLGFLVASSTALIFALTKLDKYLKEIDYRIFCIAISFGEKEKNTFVNRTINRLNKLGVEKENVEDGKVVSETEEPREKSS